MSMPGIRYLVVAILLLFGTPPQTSTEPTVRIGLDQNAAAVTVRSTSPFTVDQRASRTATFANVLAVDAAPGTAVRKSELQYRLTVTLDDDTVLVLPPDAHVRLEPVSAPLEIGDRAYRGTLEVFANKRRTLTVVNELPLETYLKGVVPNELSPVTFGQIEALKAQAVAARTYVERNLGQYKDEGYDVCASDACQVYLGMRTEDPLASQAILDTRGVIATYEGAPIKALYSSTCGGRTEDAENIFHEKVPYLVSVSCQYKHPQPIRFATSRSMPDWRRGLLAVAGVSTFADAARFMGLPLPGDPPPLTDVERLATFIRQTFYPAVLAGSDRSFLNEQGVLPPSGTPQLEDLLFRLIDRKGTFEWQQGVLTGSDGTHLRLLVNGQPKEFTLLPDALVYQRVGDDRLPVTQGVWIGGELVDFRADDAAIPMLVYRVNFANPAEDRYSRLAMWQVHKTAADLNAAFRSLAIGDLTDVRVLERGASERAVSTEVVGARGRRTLAALRIRMLLGLRDSLFSYDIERNARGALLGMTFYGRGWGHGVGMCQVGAYGMALDGASYEQILKKYYTGIDLKKVY
jgi:peptidoglycan hydrolase-like amidase